jgi:2-polyprenyl-6-methoxyphenol hydroxylase-like FAD-dependent oxidoreductase
MGINHVVIDRLEEGLNTSRAAVIHAHTLEALEHIDVSRSLSDAGLKLHRFSIRDRDRTLMQIAFDQLPSRYSFLLMLPQDVTESILLSKLESLGGRVHRGVTAHEICQNGESVNVGLTLADRRQTIEARYVVGADGMHSIVRRSAGIDFAGSQYEHSFVLADVDMDWSEGRDDVKLFFSPDGLVVVAPLPCGSYRIVATMENAPETPMAADIERILNERGPRDKTVRVSNVYWSSRFRLHHRLAGAYRKGRLLLMGDAAHVHSPAGGQGMNTGLADAMVLGQLLAAALRSKQPDAILDTYQELRRPAAQKVLKLADGLTRMATTRGRFATAARNARLSAMGHIPFAKKKLAMNLSGIARRAASEIPQPM